MLAVTGTDGKTTMTLLGRRDAARRRLRAVAAGNTEVPLVAARRSRRRRVRRRVHAASGWRDRAVPRRRRGVAQPGRRPSQLAHLDGVLRGGEGAGVHAATRHGHGHRRRRRSRRDGATSRRHPARHRTFGLRDADYHVAGGRASKARPARSVPTARCAGSLPHDLTNGLAAAALVLEPGLVGADAVALGLASFTGPPHRIELVGEADGIRWYNDSKATTPHAASAAIRAFDNIVLIAGGLNKGLDLRRWPRAECASVPSSPSAVTPRTSKRPSPDRRSPTATSMAEAVDRAGELARPGDVVLLSPGCASFDWYPDGGYPARGRRLPAPRPRTTEGSTDRDDHAPSAAWSAVPAPRSPPQGPRAAARWRRQGAHAPSAAEAAALRRQAVGVVGRRIEARRPSATTSSPSSSWCS